MSLLRRFSFVILFVAVLAAVVTVGISQPDYAIAMTFTFLGSGAVLSLIWVLLRRGRTPPNPEKRIRKSAGGPRPVLVHFYSDY